MCRFVARQRRHIKGQMAHLSRMGHSCYCDKLISATLHSHKMDVEYDLTIKWCGGGKMPCKKLETCPFFQKHKDELEPTGYLLIIKHYCKGALKESCARLIYESTRGETAPANLSPTGVSLYGH